MEDIIEQIALKVVQTGTDKTNFRILKAVNKGGNINVLMENIGLTKVPINKRINELEKVGLVNRRRGTGMVSLTIFGKDFMKSINSYHDIVGPKIMDMLKKISD